MESPIQKAQSPSAPPAPRFKWLPVVIVAVVGVFVLMVLIMTRPKPQPQPAPGDPAPIQVAVTDIQVETAALRVRSQGTVTPRHVIALQAQVGGEIVAVSPSFNNGGFFEKDETLLVIDDSDYAVALAEAKSRLAEAQRVLAEEKGRARQAKREWRDLGNEEANNLFIRKPQLAAAEAQVALAQARVERAQLDLDRTKVRAPFAGRLQTKHADLGQMIAPNTRVATIYSHQSMQVRLPLTEKQASLVQLPLQGEMLQAPAEVTLSATLAGEQVTWQGQLTRADAYIDENSRYLYAWVDIASGQLPQALPGLFVTATIQGKALDNVVKVPRSALVNRDEIVTLNTDNETVWQSVSVLEKNSDHVWVQGDFATGDKVLLEKQTLAPAGTEVSPAVQAVVELVP